MVTKPYPPGVRGKRRLPSGSEYARQLQEKQKLRFWYNLSERQFKRYVEEVLEEAHHKKTKKAIDASEALIQKLERRLDNVVYRMGFANSRRQARQLVRHGHVLVNDEKVDIPSYLVEVGDIIKIREKSKDIPFIKEALEAVARRGVPSWLEVDKERLEGRVKALPTRDEIAIPVQEQLIVEFYSK